MRFRHITCALLLGVLAIGCESRQSRALSIARDGGLPDLRADLQALVAASVNEQSDIPSNTWPASVQRFQPINVQRHMGGVLIVATRVGRNQEGLLVMLDPKDDPGIGGSGVSYQSHGDGLFWCNEKIRQQYIPPEQRPNR